MADKRGRQTSEDGGKKSVSRLYGTTSELQKYLRERGVPCANIRKAELQELCNLAGEIGLQVDPEACVEDREEVIGSKLIDGETRLTNPGQLIGSANISILPVFSVFDICSYLMSKDIALTSIRDYRRSEAYSLMQDGYVQDIAALELNVHGYFAIKASVKPRTRAQDPVSGRPVYLSWVIITDVETDSRSRILSAFCTCKGG